MVLIILKNNQYLGFFCKDKTEDGVLYALKNKLIPLDRLVIETDAPYMYPKLDKKKIPVEKFEKISEDVSFFWLSKKNTSTFLVLKFS